MGAVIRFRRREKVALAAEEQELLHRLRGSLQAMWRGGWAEAGLPSGVVLLRNQHCIGVWSFEVGRLVYRPIETGVASLQVASVEEAYERSLVLLGALLED